MELTQEQKEEIKNLCETIPGTSGWWNRSGAESFVKAAIKMAQSGFSINDAIELLKELFYSAAAEFGG